MSGFWLNKLQTCFMHIEKGVVSGTETVLNGAYGSEAKINLRVTLFSIYNYLCKQAFKNALIKGWGLNVLEMNSGWNYVAMKNGWFLSSKISIVSMSS